MVMCLSAYFTLGNFSFRVLKLTKNADSNKYSYSESGIRFNVG